eukprot:2581551-Pyramimonas_sp.AAC.1
MESLDVKQLYTTSAISKFEATCLFREAAELVECRAHRQASKFEDFFCRKWLRANRPKSKYSEIRPSKDKPMLLAIRPSDSSKCLGRPWRR